MAGGPKPPEAGFGDLLGNQDAGHHTHAYRTSRRNHARDPTGTVGVVIRARDDVADLQRLASVFDEIWGTSCPVVRVELLRAVQHAGGYLQCRGRGRSVVGGSFGFLGRHRGEPALHSHVTGILPSVRHTGLGRALKLQQRAWAADHGLAWIVWTFDPLVRRNAWFNLERARRTRRRVPRRLLRSDRRHHQREGRDRPVARRLAGARRTHGRTAGHDDRGSDAGGHRRVAPHRPAAAADWRQTTAHRVGWLADAPVARWSGSVGDGEYRVAA